MAGATLKSISATNEGRTSGGCIRHFAPVRACSSSALSRKSTRRPYPFAQARAYGAIDEGLVRPAPRMMPFELRSADRADPGAPVTTEGRWRVDALEQVGVLAGEPDVAGAVERGGPAVARAANEAL